MTAMAKKVDVPDLTRTARALETYHATEIALSVKLDRAQTDEDVKAWSRAKEEAMNLVREAFYLDTQDRNSRDTCMIVDMAWIAELVRKYGPKG